jgi:5-methylcytosine-specific restriction endonuclease McrA
MNQEEAITNWQTFNNFAFLLQIYNISIELFEEFRFYLNKILSKHDCFDNDSNMIMDDSFISFDCDSGDYMEDGNEEYCTFQSIGRNIFIVGHIGIRISTKCGYINNYPEGVIPNFLNILKLFFPSLKFIENHGLIEIWNINPTPMTFIQYLFLIIRNIQNPEFNFTQWVNAGGVEDRKENKENEFSSDTKILIRENANHCCESCGTRLLKPKYCKKSIEKILQYSKYNLRDLKLYGYIDHINEHRFGGTKNDENGQLLCHNCHSIKTRMFSKTRKLYQNIKNKFSSVSIKSSIKKITKKNNHSR